MVKVPCPGVEIVSATKRISPLPVARPAGLMKVTRPRTVLWAGTTSCPPAKIGSATFPAHGSPSSLPFVLRVFVSFTTSWVPEGRAMSLLSAAQAEKPQDKTIPTVTRVSERARFIRNPSRMEVRRFLRILPASVACSEASQHARLLLGGFIRVRRLERLAGARIDGPADDE